MSDATPSAAPDPAPTPAPAPAAAPPPAAVVVLEGTKTEREIQLEKDLETERLARRKAETDAAYAQDEFRRLKEIPMPPPPNPKKSRNTFFDDPED
jgi:hypothetical protein